MILNHKGAIELLVGDIGCEMSTSGRTNAPRATTSEFARNLSPPIRSAWLGATPSVRR